MYKYRSIIIKIQNSTFQSVILYHVIGSIYKIYMYMYCIYMYWSNKCNSALCNVG